MKFNKATNKLLSEMDMSSVTGMRRNDTLLGRENGDDLRIRIMRKMGADSKIISRWKAAENRGITFESFLIGLVDELKNRKADYTNDDDDFDFK